MYFFSSILCSFCPVSLYTTSFLFSLLNSLLQVSFLHFSKVDKSVEQLCKKMIKYLSSWWVYICSHELLCDFIRSTNTFVLLIKVALPSLTMFSSYPIWTLVCNFLKHVRDFHQCARWIFIYINHYFYETFFFSVNLSK